MRDVVASSRLVLGVDGGNSKTLAAVADEHGHVLGVGRSGSGSHQALGIEGSMTEIRAAVSTALQMAGRTPEELDGAFYALAGADLEEDFAVLRPALGALHYGRCFEFDNDTIAGLRAGARRRDAVVVVVGSGTNAAGTNAAGDAIRLPGLGWISGDWGGGSAMAREAVRLVMRAWDGRGDPTLLTEMILNTLGAATVEDLLLALYRKEIRGTQLLAVTPLIFEAAEEGDTVAQSIIEMQAREVVDTAGGIMRRLGIAGSPCDIVLAGSVFRDRTGRLVDSIRERLSNQFPQACAVVSELEPVLGAVLCGMDLLRLPTTEDVRRNLFGSFSALYTPPSYVEAL